MTMYSVCPLQSWIPWEQTLLSQDSPTMVDVVCLSAVLLVPALEVAKHNFFVWLILGLLTLYVLFMWMVLGRRNTNGYDAESDREADISKELLSQRNKWYM